MSLTSKIVLGLAILAVVLLGGFYYWHSTQPKASPTATSNEEVTTLPSGSKSDDASIEQDFSSIDAQLQGVQSDNSDVNASVNAAAAQ